MPRHTRRSHILGLAAMSAFMGVSKGNAAEIKDYFDTWSGTLAVGAIKLRLELDILSETAASLYSIDQGGGEIKASSVKLTADSIMIEFAVIGASYTGSLSAPDRFTGTFTQGGQPMPLEFQRGELFVSTAPSTAKIEPLTPEVLKHAREEANIPGIGAAYARNGGAASILVDGLRSSDAAVVITPSDQWHWGSNTKSMTSTLVARLIEAGGITWDTTVGEVLGSLTPDMNEAYKAVTFRHLLSHHAGLPRDIDEVLSFSRERTGDPRPDRLKYATLALKQTPDGPMGTKMLYSNSGYIIAGAMLETVYKRSWEDLITAYVFKPLKLNSAGFGAPGDPGKLDQPLGHQASPADPAKRIPAELGAGHISDLPVAMGPAGLVHMNLTDIITYLNAHLLCPADFLKAENWKILHTPPYGGNYAMGWLVSSEGVLWHNGSNTLWYAEMAVDPVKKITAAVAANDRTTAEPVVGALLKSALLRAFV